jgi:predicted site-specific integrase-resolvase
MEGYVTTRIAQKTFGVTAGTLRIWANKGAVETIRTPGGKRLYNVSKYLENHRPTTSPTPSPDPGQRSICYCRVSSTGQKDDLERQATFMQERFPTHRIIRDIGSGINFKRRGLLQVLDLANRGLVDEVVVAHRDRLCRFAFDLVEWMLRAKGVRLLVLDQQNDSAPGSELADDLMAIVQVFSCRANGRRKYRTTNKTRGPPNQAVPGH